MVDELVVDRDGHVVGGLDLLGGDELGDGGALGVVLLLAGDGDLHGGFLSFGAAAP